ncbi:MAG: penicillin-binding protein [Candidatus Gracilibacteria bacterium]|nr:penicillin-binding protein [Candidatus Gracilibacteria bacterium]
MTTNIEEIPYSTIIYDIKGNEIAEINYGEFRHRYLDIDDYPDFLKRGVIFLEDRSFYNNIGIDFLAIFRAVWRNFEEGKVVEGASTISSQLIRNTTGLNEKRTFWKKLQEFGLAVVINAKYSKEDILEKYLNNVSFGYMNFGYESASYYYFGKSVKNLTKAQLLALMVIPKNAIKYDPYKKFEQFKIRYNLILNLFKENGIISEEDEIFIKNEKIEFNEKNKPKLPYIKDFLENNYIEQIKGKKEIYLNIDYFLTKKVEHLAKNVVDKLYWKNVRDYGLIILDRHTSDLKVMIGGYSYDGPNGQVNSALRPRQAGSTIKPFTYSLAFKDLGWDKNTIILDLPVEFKTDKGYAYNPKNYSLDYKGQVSVAQALSQSLNIPAVKTLYEVGEKKLLDFLRDLKITSLDKDVGYYGLALTLGVGEISLFELTRSYNIFAQDGNFCEINIFKNNSKQTNCEKKIDKKITDEITEILTNRFYKLEGFPVNSALDFGNRKVFVKTGTSRNFRDNWAMGFTKNYIIGVWAGNKDGSEMKGVSGATGAGQIFREIVDNIEKDFDEIKAPNIQEKNKEKYLNIISPLPNSKYKLDEYKQEKNQKIKLDFVTNIEYDSARFFVDNKEVEKFYTPKKGTHILEIVLFKNKEKVGEKNLVFEVK